MYFGKCQPFFPKFTHQSNLRPQQIVSMEKLMTYSLKNYTSLGEWVCIQTETYWIMLECLEDIFYFIVWPPRYFTEPMVVWWYDKKLMKLYITWLLSKIQFQFTIIKTQHARQERHLYPSFWCAHYLQYKELTDVYAFLKPLQHI